MLAFADDIVMFTDTDAEMHKILDVLLEYCSLNRLSANVQKTNVMIFKKGGRDYQNIAFYFDNKEIKIVNEYTYLEIIVSRGRVFFAK